MNAAMQILDAVDASRRPAAFRHPSPA